MMRVRAVPIREHPDTMIVGAANTCQAQSSFSKGADQLMA